MVDLRVLHKLKNMLFQNFLWKLLAVVFAAALWFYSVSIINPEIVRTIPVPLELKNISALEKYNLSLTNGDALSALTVDIQIRGRQADVEYLRSNKQYVKATLDLNVSNITNNPKSGDEIKAYIDVTILRNADRYQIEHQSVHSVPIQLDRILTRRFDIVYDTGNTEPEGYTVQNVLITPKRLDVTAPETVLNSIKQVSVDLDLTDSTTDFSVSLLANAYDSDGTIITNVSFSEEVVKAEVQIRKEKSVYLPKPVTTGVLAEEYMLTEDVRYSPKTILIRGKEESLEKLRIQPIVVDITGKSESFTMEVDIRDYFKDAEGNKLIDLESVHDEEKMITINVTIEKVITKEFEVPTSQISISGYSTEFYVASKDETVTVNMRGAESIVNNIKVEDITGTVNVFGLDIGQHELTVGITLPSGAELDPLIVLPTALYEIYDITNLPEGVDIPDLEGDSLNTEDNENEDENENEDGEDFADTASNTP